MRLANGREASALDIQSEYLSRALRYAEHRGSRPLEKQALEMWEHCLTSIEKDPLTLDRECDWVIKHKLIEAYRERHDLPLDPPQGRADGPAVPRRQPRPGPLLQDAGRAAWSSGICNDADIDHAVDEPPQTTRARLRGEFIRRAKERKRDYTVDWVHLKLNDQAQRTVLCKDPFKSHDERVEKLIASL